MNKHNKPETFITQEFLEDWANWEVNDDNCLMSRETQQLIKDMAIELLEARNK